MEEFGVVIRQWSCPVGWHRSVKWHGEAAYCIEPGCDRSNVEVVPDTPLVRPMVIPAPRSVITIKLPENPAV
jgi:hypothetical protein